MTQRLNPLVRGLLRLYPKSFRERFGDSMEEALTDRIAAAKQQPATRRWTMLLGITVDLGISTLKERIRPSYRPTPNHTPTGRANIMDKLLQDLRFAFRSLRRRPGFTLTAVLTLALGIGANTAVFSVVHGVLMSPLPFPAPEELVMLWANDVDRPTSRGWMSLPDLDDARDLGVFAAIEGYQSGNQTFSFNDRPERVSATRVTGSLLDVFGLAPIAGRDLRHEENAPGTPHVAIVGHGFWQEKLNGRADIVGTSIVLSERTYEVVGIAPEGFDYPDGTELWIPYRHGLDGCGRGCSVYQTVGRLAPGRSAETIQQPLTALASGLSETYPTTNTDKGFHTESLVDVLVGDVKTGLWALLGAVGLVLMIVCANLANLLLARASSRRSEVSVRSALGASGPRLVSQILTESLVLGALGGGLGILLSSLLVQGFRWIAPVTLPRMEDVSLSPSVLLFALATTAIVAVLFGLSPALHLVRSSAASELTRGARAGRRNEGRARSVLMAAEIAMSVALLIGAGLLTRTLGQLYNVDMGFQASNVLRFSVNLPRSRYDSLPEIAAFYQTLEEQIRALPGVEAVGSAFGSPLGGNSVGGSVSVEGRPDPAPGAEMFTRVRPATAGYFDAMGLSVLRGRGITPTDVPGSEAVVVINETFASQNFGDGNPLGERIAASAGFGFTVPDYWRIVGVVKDVRPNLTGTPDPAMYVPHSQFGPGYLRVHVRGLSSVAQLMPTIRNQVRTLDPNLAIAGVETVQEAIRNNAAPTRFYLLMVSLFAGLAVLVASVGLYGVVTYLATGRTREFGIRMALGARSPEISNMVLRQGLVPTAWGILGGILISIVGGRWIQSLLYGVNPWDPAIFLGVSALIAVVATLASLLPARRATRINPTQALRAE